MNCPYCSNPLQLIDPKGLHYRGAKCNSCPLPISFTIDYRAEKILHIFIELDNYVTPNARMIYINYRTKSMELHRTDPHGDTYVILQLNHIPNNFSPTNIEDVWSRLTNLMVFS